jgi:anti-sigma B factor antagonist
MADLQQLPDQVQILHLPDEVKRIDSHKPALGNGLLHTGHEPNGTSSSCARKGQSLSLHIEQRESESIIILDLRGLLTLGHGDSELRDRLHALHQSGKVNIILNLRDVSEIDSTGLGTLVFGLARLRKSDGGLALLNLNQSHMKLFLLTRLAIAFEFFDDEQDAVNSFFPDRALKRFDILNFVQHQGNPDATHRAGSGAAC